MHYGPGYVVLAIISAAHIVSGAVNTVDTDHLQPPLWTVQFEYEQLNMTMRHAQKVSFVITAVEPALGSDFEFRMLNDNGDVAYIDEVTTVLSNAKGVAKVKGNFTLHATLLGYTHVYVELQRAGYETQRSAEVLRVIVTRSLNLADIIFNISIACFVMVIYVNFGAVLDLEDLKRIVIRPVGPAIGLFCQFLVMPVLSFVIGYFLFREMIELRLGLFFLGVSPAGGSSNIFAVLLNGNLSLSITMTAISNLAAFGMMPLWIFTLGALIFRDGNFAIPYKSIASVSCTLVVPIAIGIMLQKYAPEVTKKMSKLLKPISLVLILAITIFGCVLNSYMWKLFTTKILIGSCILPWLGYVIGWLIATVLRQPPKDAITIAIETGIQNIGIAIFMLNFTLPQPQADMTSAVPMANSMLTPLPLLLIYFLKLCFCRKREKSVDAEANAKEAKESELVTFMENGMEKANSKYPQ
ncbi:sodium/bile acid cotransporter-like [Bactrocera tryoni]|uniref:sodium/bile acid cotransporter-like n=1 Tax=Bactrocera tryoni TaxID=59916 RepID=UPI001A97F3C5|nr:sodium/bile acid cotransporter-like [Bactrocera tryoni]XP_039962294.1 sodium/bile acid cotransporter-like [Bactrocera tryoni]XP_039962295.1 sodium/bile acid cotransporter-like [Bactrocera tryoni]